MSDALFDRYREALRAGHVAVLRGRLEDAAASYREAGALARDRAVPRTALGSVELRLGQPELALATFDEALELVPMDDAALLGRAQALVVLRRPEDAAATYDSLADARHAAGKPVEACDALRRSLEIQPTVARRERYQELTEELRRAPGGAESGDSTSRAVGLLEVASAVEAPAVTPDPASVSRDDAEPTTATTDGPSVDAAPVDAAPVDAAPVDALPVVDGDALVLAAEEAASRGDAQGAVAAAMAAAHAFRAAGHPTAALDACVGGLKSGPDDVDLHLLIADLAVERGAIGPAADAYRNLLRLVEIDGDGDARDRVLAAARAAFPDDPRFVPA